MPSEKKRMRVFAGPNGSGKTTIIDQLRNRIPFGQYVNADDIERDIKIDGFLDLRMYSLNVDTNALQHYFKNSEFAPKRMNLPELWKNLRVENEKLLLSSNITINSYLASDIAEWIRQNLLETGMSFTYETVMSFKGKLDFMNKARNMGYRVYLYYISTEDPEININRVKIRVSMSGHSVAPETIRDRYYKSLQNLKQAVKLSDRAYLFDNSGEISRLIATVMHGKEVDIIDPDTTPNWLVENLMQ